MIEVQGLGVFRKSLRFQLQGVEVLSLHSGTAKSDYMLGCSLHSPAWSLQIGNLEISGFKIFGAVLWTELGFQLSAGSRGEAVKLWAAFAS